MKIWLTAAVVIVLALIGGSYFLNQNKTEEKNGETNTTEEKKFGATLEINDGESVKHYDLVNDVVGKTALEVTKDATSGKVVTSGEGENAYVTSINGREASTTKKEFWELLVNGKQSQVGAGSYQVKSGDKIEWKISTY